ncbi:hypothetical protein L195_g062031, partial [Trifolium pratense]
MSKEKKMRKRKKKDKREADKCKVGFGINAEKNQRNFLA